MQKEVTFATKLELARRMLERALEAGLPVASVLPKSGGRSFASSANRLTLLLTTCPGHAGDARNKLLHDFAITNVDALSHSSTTHILNGVEQRTC